MIDFGIITAPRDPETLNFTIKSFREKLWAHFDIFAEPGEYHIKHSDCNIYVAKEKYGAFKNYDRALRHLLTLSGELLCVCNDDYIFGKNLNQKIEYIEAQKEKDWGYYALFTNSLANNCPEKYKTEGWHINPDGWHTWHYLFVMKKSVVREMMKHEFYVNHLNNYEKNQQIDGCVAETIKRMKLHGFVHNPSIASAFGMSTLGHTGIYEGFNFKSNI